MSTMTLSAPAPAFRAGTALFLAVAMAATVGSALAFQYVGGYIPCKLCLEQRIPYYVGAPLMALALLNSLLRGPRMLTRGLLAVGGVLMLYGLYLGVYHSGIEWKLWAGPPDCSGPLDSLNAGGGLLSQLNTIHIARCDTAAWRFFGLSLAGYNVLISLLLAAVALWGLRARWRNADPD